MSPNGVSVSLFLLPQEARNPWRVKAPSLEGQASEEASYAFTILPPWYRSSLAYALYGVLALFTVIAARQGVIRHEREKSRRQTEALEAQAKAKAEAKAKAAAKAEEGEG